ncbi:MAG: hypothetical protein RLY92_197 [Chloroflexota bacterium]|jgi:DNA-3-methyladenine glycosylase
MNAFVLEPGARLPRSFFAQPTLTVARSLPGKLLVRLGAGGSRQAGVIVETEAYIGESDLACHARSGRTRRTAVMYGAPGTAYVYFTYGMHWMLNIVTEHSGFPAAVLLRALHLCDSPAAQPQPATNGPAKLTRALQLDGTWNTHDMCAPDAQLFVEQPQQAAPPRIVCKPRVGLGKTPQPWLGLPWNFCLGAHTGS